VNHEYDFVMTHHIAPHGCSLDSTVKLYGDKELKLR
jgi:hypothetical protein